MNRSFHILYRSDQGQLHFHRYTAKLPAGQPISAPWIMAVHHATQYQQQELDFDHWEIQEISLDEMEVE